MPQTFLILDFGTSEEAAQQARHILERWKQSFRLDKKLLLKFDRAEPAEASDKSGKEESAKAASQAKKEKAEASGGAIKMVVRLDFSDHEKLSHKRWIDRISGEELQAANPKIVRHGDAEFEATADRFQNLE